jgi:arylsulfatase A-like enzyme
MDVLPTISAMTGSPLPKKEIDGLNFMPLLLGKTENGPRESFYYYYNQNSLKAVRYKHWKLVLPHTSASYENEKPGKDGYPGKIGELQVKQALYNLAHDPGEKVDLQDLYPEVVAQIMKLVETAREDLGDDLTKREGSNRRKAAVVE